MNQLEQSPLSAKSKYDEKGFSLIRTLLPDDLVQKARTRVEAVLRGEYETGVSPTYSNDGEDPKRLRKVNDAHLCDNTLFEVATHPGIGRWASEITGRPWIQLWATQMLYKPQGGSKTGNVGWHQDRQYWKYWEDDSELFTAWVALSDVTEEAGAMRFASGSHHWGFLDRGDFFASDQSAPIQPPEGAKWLEVPGVLSPGGVSFHHCLTYHGSGPNLSTSPRISLALHLRTDRSRPKFAATDYYVAHLDDPKICPVIYNREADI
jgi:ectoine hydroxylase-related dioxygenase (phytanoyl-CoA dioxygenase family)